MTRDELVNSVKTVIASLRESKSGVRGISIANFGEQITFYKGGRVVFLNTPEQFADLLFPPPPWRDKPLAELPPGKYVRYEREIKTVVVIDDRCCIESVHVCLLGTSENNPGMLTQDDLTATNWQPYEEVE